MYFLEFQTLNDILIVAFQSIWHEIEIYFLPLLIKMDDFVSYDDNDKWKILCPRMISKFLNPTIEDVLLIKGWKRNLIIISQLCDKKVTK